MVAFSLKVFAVLALASFGAVAGTSSTDCPTPTTPENGEYLFYQGRMTVKYSCKPGHRLVGKVFSVCQNDEWSSPAPQCEPINDASPLPSNKEGVLKAIKKMISKSKNEDSQESVLREEELADDTDMQSDEASRQRQIWEYMAAHNYYYPYQSMVDGHYPYYYYNPYYYDPYYYYYYHYYRPT